MFNWGLQMPPNLKVKNECAVIWPVERKLLAVESWLQSSGSRWWCFGDGQSVRKKQTGEFPKQFSFPFVEQVSLSWGCCCGARKQDEAGLLWNSYFFCGKPPWTVLSCSSHWGFRLIPPAAAAVVLWHVLPPGTLRCPHSQDRSGRFRDRLWWWGQSSPRRFLLTRPFPSPAINTSETPATAAVAPTLFTRFCPALLHAALVLPS